MKSNTRARSTARTHEGGMAVPQKPLAELERTVVNCLLFENTFYESGNDIAHRIKSLVCETKITPQQIHDLAVKTRTELGLRHVSLYVAACLAFRVSRNNEKYPVASTIEAVIKRADELAEFLKLYWHVNGKRCPLSAQVKLGLARAFTKFNEYSLAKYNQDNDIKLRDVLFLCHAKPKDTEQEALFRNLVDNKLQTPDTWEVALSAGEDKRATWTRLLAEKQLGTLALLRNLRNMEQVGVDRDAVISALQTCKTWGVLPHQFIAAGSYVPAYSQHIEEAMFRALGEMPKLSGTTILLVDVSGSMHSALSGKSEMERLDTAMALAIQVREQAQDARIFTFSSDVREVPSLRGFGLINAIHNSQPHHSTMLANALRKIQMHIPRADRIIVITDEQSQDGIQPSWVSNAYVMNVAAYAPGLSTSGGWQRINGFSQQIVKWILATEEMNRG